MNPRTSSPDSQGQFWEREFDLSDIVQQNIRFGLLALHFRVEDGDLWISRSYGEEVPGTDPIVSNALTWQRWPLGKARKVRFEVLFPDRPIVVKPRVDLLLYPKGEMDIYVGCPLWIRVCLKGKEQVPLIDFPSQILSQTWFGTNTVEGEICYWVESEALRTVFEAPPHIALCPVHVRNTSGDELTIQRICLRIAHLTLYRDRRSFWSDLTRIDFRGRTGQSEFWVSGQPPAEAEHARELAGPRERSLSRLVARTFATVRDFPSFHFFSE